MPASVRRARRLRVHGIVQGVGFRPFVYRLARRHGLAGWVRNAGDGVHIHVEGPEDALRRFEDALRREAPPAAEVSRVEAADAEVAPHEAFEIRESRRAGSPTTRISPDLSVCPECLREMRDPADRRFRYPYLNCTNCGPRYSIITALPYDRPHTTMRAWPMCAACVAEYHDPLDRRFHAQPTACPDCGPHYALREDDAEVARGFEALTRAVSLLREGKIVAVKGLGGYHLACDARNAEAVAALRARKFRKEKPFALMTPDLDAARRFARITPAHAGLLTSVARPIVLLPRRNDPGAELPEAVAPGNPELGVMLPYTPIHALLFDLGAPVPLVMTSANRSSEPIAFRDDDALARLSGLADAFLTGERPIARRIDDSVVRVTGGGAMLLRRARGYAPGVVARLSAERPILAVGADLKNTVTLVVGGEAFMSPYVGDLEHYDVQTAFEQTIRDLTAMYAVPLDEALVVHDAHPHYHTTRLAEALPGEHVAVQHHRAHVASVLAERGAADVTVIGFAFDGTGYGDDGVIWGGEVFAGSLRDGFMRAAHLREALLPGGDAAARTPVQAAAGFLHAVPGLPDLTAPPFRFPDRFRTALRMIEKNLRVFPTTSMGRLFDTVAALLGFTRTMSFEGQAAVWLEHLARSAPPAAPYPFPGLDYRPLLRAVLDDRLRGRPAHEIARAFHASVAHEIARLGARLAAEHDARALVLSGGVFQNALLLEALPRFLAGVNANLPVWVNRRVPANDGGVSLGQAALAAYGASLR
ncbi:carbamoyltransferase HypF [Rhodocaloribacter sp.]